MPTISFRLALRRFPSVTRPAPGRLLFALALAFVAPPAAAVQCTVPGPEGGLVGLPSPVLFVSQVPIAADFATIGSTFANHLADLSRVGRGGDLWILYPDGALCNVTREAGLGVAGQVQGPGSIAVRDPAVHPDADRALVSIVVGTGPEARWQIHEVVGLGRGLPVAITRVALQPAGFHNVDPLYSPDGRILFASDRPRDGRLHLYPQLDEYESTETNTGLWALDRATGELTLLDHSPSGVFDPRVDSFGRIVFTRWDHLQRDQQAESSFHQAVDFVDEEPGSPTTAPSESFPEPRVDPPAPLLRHRFNHFFPWMIHADGSGLETINHVGRHELHHFFTRNRDDDPNLDDHVLAIAPETANDDAVLNLFQTVEDAATAGRYVATVAPEFGTHASGGLVRFDAPPHLPADQIVITALTHPTTRLTVPEGETAPAEHSGHYRDPLPLSDGTLVASHTFETRRADDEGSAGAPDPRYDFRLRTLAPDGLHVVPAAALTGTSGLVRTVTWTDPNTGAPVTTAGALWELGAVEVRMRPGLPTTVEADLEAPEQAVFDDEGVDPDALRAYLRDRGLALVVSRDVTTRDRADRQQPFNLRVAGGTAATVPEDGAVYDLARLQFFQGDLVRAYEGLDLEGRRVLAREMHEPIANPPSAGPPGSVDLGPDGSMAAMVPAHRAMTWQLLDPAHEPVVRERYWLTFAAGEIRVCGSCHGLNSADQVGAGAPQNPPEALRTLLRHWNTLFADGFESGDASAWGG